MNRRMIALALAGVALLGLTACSGGTASNADKAPATSAPATESAAAQKPAADQTVAEACVSMAGPMQKASTTMAGLAEASSNPQSAVDAWTALVDAYQEVADTVTNADVKAATIAATTDLTVVRDAIKKVYVDGDTAAIAEMTTASTNMQTSLTALTTLCAG